ncbi:MAG: hypothetical protein QOD26_2365 [Betaproteobacteria bacterium]|jgi:hypothetical protein|nr:hypothetical protein [Betaproteobacteria bacterium]
MTRLLLLLALTLPLAPARAQELGRLFFTPDQRAALDARRKARVPDKPAATTVVSPTTRLDGYVKRSTGPSTVWVNGEGLLETSPDAPRIGATSSDDGRVSVPVGEGGARVGMRPGETLDRGSGEVRDVIGEGEIRVQPGKPAP